MSAKRSGRFIAALLLLAGSAHGQTTDAAAAQELFNDGKRLMSAGQYTAACPKFAESQRLDPGIGTLLWLADCQAKSGLTASAWATFQLAEALAAKQRDPRVAVARDEAKKLEPKLSRLTIEVPAAASTPGLTIRRDGVELGKPTWNTAVPTDPGAHTISASAPSKVEWQGRVTVPAEGAASIKIPLLASAPVGPTSRPSDPNRGSTQRIVGASLFGLGVVGVALTTYFGLDAISKSHDADRSCIDAGCPASAPGALELRKDARSSATVADISAIAGALLLVGGAVLYLTAPRPAKTADAARFRLAF